MSNFPKVHPRERITKEAAQKLRLAIAEVTRELTTWETTQVVALVFGEELSGIAKYQIRYERHGNYDTPGGFASCGGDEKRG